MAIEYKWSISYADVKTEPHNGLNQVITSCRWAVTAIDGNMSSSTFGYAEFEDPNPENFTACSEVKQDAMLAWVWKDVDRQHIEDSLAADIEANKAPSTTQLTIPV